MFAPNEDAGRESQKKKQQIASPRNRTQSTYESSEGATNREILTSRATGRAPFRSVLQILCWFGRFLFLLLLRSRASGFVLVIITLQVAVFSTAILPLLAVCWAGGRRRRRRASEAGRIK
jgi:hypothetical protein